jgi:hypothetical protein
MKNKEYAAYTGTNPDRVYGEIYEYNGIYWAEVILVEDGLDWVTEKSADFRSQERAEAWLADRKVALPKTFSETLNEQFGAEAIGRYWNRFKEFSGLGRKHAVNAR